ncbi:hypothetical protein V8F20_012317 [Naviculisporaceae sp. PSN 640]
MAFFASAYAAAMPRSLPKWKFNKSLLPHSGIFAWIKNIFAAPSSSRSQTKTVRFADEQDDISPTVLKFPSKQTLPRSILKRGVSQPKKATQEHLENWESVMTCQARACQKCRTNPARCFMLPGDVYNQHIQEFLNPEEIPSWNWKLWVFYFFIAIIWLMILGSFISGPSNRTSYAVRVDGHSHSNISARMVARLWEAEG